ncbi:MAG: hypothetical protein WCO35_02810 [Candidatus Nomurabacteria bacterium]
MEHLESLNLIIEKLGFILKVYKKISRKINLLIIRSKRIRIGIAIDSRLDEEIINYCNSEMKNSGLNSKIKFERIYLKNKNSKSIEKMIDDSNKLFLIVWCPVKSNSLSFSYKERGDRIINKIIITELNKKVIEKNLLRLDKKSFEIDIDYEKPNIKDFSLYIVANIITFLRSVREGMDIFEKLNEEMSKDERVLKDLVQTRLQQIYNSIGNSLAFENKYEDSLVIFNKANSLNSKDINTLAGLSVTKFETGDEKGSEESVKLMFQEYPDDPVSIINMSFIHLKNGNYKKMFKLYKKYKKVSNHNTTLEVIEFFNRRINKNPDRFEYLFARGFFKSLISKTDIKIYGKTSSDDDYKSFLKRANKERYIYLVNYLKKRIIIM